jgi:hypothetical protein
MLALFGVGEGVKEKPKVGSKVQVNDDACARF